MCFENVMITATLNNFHTSKSKYHIFNILGGSFIELPDEMLHKEVQYFIESILKPSNNVFQNTGAV